MNPKVKRWLQFVLVILFRILGAWAMLRLAGYELDPHQVAYIIIALWLMLYNIGGKQQVVNNLVYKGNEDAKEVQ